VNNVEKKVWSSGNPMPEDLQLDLSVLKISNSVKGSNYWRNLVIELIRGFPVSHLKVHLNPIS